jgi:hypothetical protein
MKLTEALTKISGSTKTAAVSTPVVTATASTSDATERLKQALKEATASDVGSKTAAAKSPVEDLTKIAADLSKAEHEALVKEAQLYGAAVCDGFMARAAQYQEATAKVAAAQPAVKTASATNDSFDKFASENPDLVKEAMMVGYNSTSIQLEKLAEEAYVKGYNDTLKQAYDTACNAFVAGFKGAMDLMESRS